VALRRPCGAGVPARREPAAGSARARRHQCLRLAVLARVRARSLWSRHRHTTQQGRIVVRRLVAPAVAVVASARLIAGYLGPGGRAYRPAAVADPCAHRPWRAPNGVAETLEQVALSTADGAACTLGVSREDLVLALAGSDDLSHFAQTHHISQGDAERAIRDGLIRAVDDAEAANAIDGGLAGALRSVARHLPIGIVLDAIQ